MTNLPPLMANYQSVWRTRYQLLLANSQPPYSKPTSPLMSNHVWQTSLLPYGENLEILREEPIK
jgi:hypothetical protein